MSAGGKQLNVLDPCEAEAFSDEDLARAARQGSLSDFEKLVSRYEESIFSFIRAQCGNAADAQELSQDTFLKAWQAMGSWKESMRFKPWLFTIARRKCIDHHRARRPAEPLSDDPAQAGQNSPVEAIVQREEGTALWSLARRVLPKDQFQCVWLRYMEDMGVSEISAVTGKSRVHVKVLLFRGRMTLARHVKGAAKAQPDRAEPIGTRANAMTTNA